MQRSRAWQGPCRLAAAALLFGFFTATAHAAPQVLALVATEGPVPLRCEAGVCRVELATLCVQPERRAPSAGRLYRPHLDDAIELVGDSGQKLPLPTAARLTATRTHVAVRLELPQAWVTRHLTGAATVRVPATAALVPVPQAGDARPLTPAELARATGPDLALAAGIVDDDPARRAAVALSAQLINGLPAGADAETAERQWSRFAVALPAELRTREAIGLARFQFEFCRYNAANGLSASLTQCLAAQQDGAMEVLHRGYLEAHGAGS